MPALRERREEIPLLLQHFMARFAVRYARDPLPLSSALIDAAIGTCWPGNLRELENFVKRYLILGDERQAIQELRGRQGECHRRLQFLPDAGEKNSWRSEINRTRP